jgi:hypothetical protein
VLFRTEAPAPGLPYDLADSWLVIHHAAAYGPQDNAFDLGAANPTGPYRVTAFETRVRAELARRKRHRGVRHAEVVPFIPLAGPDGLTAVHRAVRNYVPHFLSWGPAEVHPDLWPAA